MNDLTNSLIFTNSWIVFYTTKRSINERNNPYAANKIRHDFIEI